MISLKIAGDRKSPDIHFDSYTGDFEIKGRSNLENPMKFYEPVFIWLNNYIKKPALRTTIRIDLEYFNSASSKMLLKIFRTLETLHGKDNHKVLIQWCYPGLDGSMMEAGEDFKSVLKLNFEFLRTED